MVSKTATDQLPSLPQVLVRILEAIRNDNEDYQSIAEIIRQDGGVATKLITAANSSFYGRPSSCESIERALLFLGTDIVKTIAITTSIKQFYSHFNQQHRTFLRKFWRRSLISANFAQVLATLTNYGSPEEAYLCGLLVDLGQLMFLTNNEKSYLALLEEMENDQQLVAAEEQQFSQNHCQLGADLIESWNISSFMADAVRYHHEPVNLVADAHHLVKIINLSSLLAVNEELDDTALAAADALFGLNESLTRELRGRINDDVDAIAESLNIDINNNEQTGEAKHNQARIELGEHLSELNELAQVNWILSQAETREALQLSAQRAMFLTLDIPHSVLFLTDEHKQQLQAQPSNNEQNSLLDFKIPIEANRSLICDALLTDQEQTSENSDRALSVVDRQLQRYCRSDILVCWPLKIKTKYEIEKVGVIVFACNERQLAALKSKQSLSRNLCTEIAAAMVNYRNRISAISYQQPSAEFYQQQISEVVHEAGNPLSIIRNYLEMLRIKLGDGHSAHEGIELIKEEIDRVGNLLLRLNDPESTQGDTQIDINDVITSTAVIFQNSICATNQIELTLNLDKKLAPMAGNAEHLKQILTNLIKNATEALSPGNAISVSSDASVSFNGKAFISIHVTDNGPGIPEDIKKNLFSPVESTKGNGHSGLGLSIVKKLIDEMNGTILCRSSEGRGTEFQILLPKS